VDKVSRKSTLMFSSLLAQSLSTILQRWLCKFQVLSYHQLKSLAWLQTSRHLVQRKQLFRCKLAKKKFQLHGQTSTISSTLVLSSL
jgi:hypothetical protein